MDFGLTEEQQQLKDSARNFLSRECPTTRVREIIADEAGMPHDLYQQIANLGWNGLTVTEKFGGAGLGMLDMSLLLEESGYAALPGPFLFSSVLAASALAGGGSEEVNDRWLGRLAEGQTTGTVAIVEANDSINPDAFGRRMNKTISGTITQFLHDGSNPGQELNNTNGVVANLMTGLRADEYFTRTASGTTSPLVH